MEEKKDFNGNNSEETQVNEQTSSEEVKSQEDEKDLRIAELENELKKSEDKYLRVFSEFENYKKRLEKEKFQAIEFACESFGKDLLPILDNLQMAINSANNSNSEELKQLKEGVELTLKNFLSMLAKNGIEKISTENGFDPNLHEAVMKVDSDEVESGEIVQVLQEGYKLKDRVLRATMVSIAN